MDRTISLRSPRPGEASALTELCFRSKAVHGYGEDFLQACRAELTVSEEALPNALIQVAECCGELVGMAQISVSEETAELEKLFVEPSAIGHGVGRLLFGWARNKAREAGAKLMAIDADPGAADFYLRMGASNDGLAPSASIPGRFLPRLVVKLA